jgi:uncharacterized protein YjbI with pentapeptide repeats
MSVNLSSTTDPRIEMGSGPGCGIYPHDGPMSRAMLGGAILTKANLRRANLSNADMRETCLNGTDLRQANLNDARLDGAQYTSTTRWPQGLNAAECGARLVTEESLQDMPR